MTRSSEILFIDPGVDDISTLLAGVRPEVTAKVLDPARPARQIARSLKGLRDLNAVHIIAHGAPGRVTFSAEEWSAKSLAGQADDLAAIGRALGDAGGLRLWSC